MEKMNCQEAAGPGQTSGDQGRCSSTCKGSGAGVQGPRGAGRWGGGARGEGRGVQGAQGEQLPGSSTHAWLVEPCVQPCPHPEEDRPPGGEQPPHQDPPSGHPQPSVSTWRRPGLPGVAGKVWHFSWKEPAPLPGPGAQSPGRRRAKFKGLLTGAAGSHCSAEGGLGQWLVRGASAGVWSHATSSVLGKLIPQASISHLQNGHKDALALEPGLRKGLGAPPGAGLPPPCPRALKQAQKDSRVGRRTPWPLQPGREGRQVGKSHRPQSLGLARRWGCTASRFGKGGGPRSFRPPP